MKKRYSTIFTITVATLLVGSVAYAAKKKLQTKSKPMFPDVSEVDLAAGLFDADVNHKQKSSKDNDTKTSGDEQLKDLIIAMKPDKE
ncbi:MAG: hypothetical protein PHH28_01435 [Desulfuromonadaceae bacterium]|nr:hypothetical protein [Desulfuromonadaceae bacterium]